MAIGQKLEEARNRKGISIREASESTKIRGDYLSAFESNNFEIKLPEVYLRGFVRLYARFLDIDQDAILVDLDLELGANSGKNLRKSLGSITSKAGLAHNEYAKGVPSNKIKRGGNVQSTFTKPIIIISSSLLTLVIIVSVLTYSFSGDDNSNSPSMASPQNIKESVKSDINIDQAKAIITNEYSLRLAAIGPIQMLIIDDEGKGIYLRLRDGIRYQGLPGNENINILNFDLYDLEIVSGEIHKSISNFSEIEEKSTLDLMKEGGLLANAEIQWRFSQPISILIFSILGVFLGKTSPRTGKGINILIGIVFFILYNNGMLVAKTAIERGELSPIIGIWGVHLLLLLLLLLFYQFRQGKIMYLIDKITIFNNKKKSHA